jgi:hypothetical protein
MSLFSEHHKNISTSKEQVKVSSNKKIPLSSTQQEQERRPQHIRKTSQK